MLGGSRLTMAFASARKRADDPTVANRPGGIVVRPGPLSRAKSTGPMDAPDAGVRVRRNRGVADLPSPAGTGSSCLGKSGASSGFRFGRQSGLLQITSATPDGVGTAATKVGGTWRGSSTGEPIIPAEQFVDYPETDCSGPSNYRATWQWRLPRRLGSLSASVCAGRRVSLYLTEPQGVH